MVSGCQRLEQQSALYLRHRAIIIPTLTPHSMYIRYEPIQGDKEHFTLAFKVSLLLMPTSPHKQLRQTLQHNVANTQPVPLRPWQTHLAVSSSTIGSHMHVCFASSCRQRPCASDFAQRDNTPVATALLIPLRPWQARLVVSISTIGDDFSDTAPGRPLQPLTRERIHLK